jgi:hypothetical protein
MKTKHLAWFSSVLLALFTVSLPAQVIFTDNFDAGASPLWSNLRGAWTAAGGVYSATYPQNIPPTFTGLPFVLENFAVDVDINQVADGGVWLRCGASGTNGVLLVTGGFGWGSGIRGGNAGRSLYWHVITPQNWSSPPVLGEVDNVFTNPGVQNVHLRVEVVGNRYSAFLNGSTNATTVIVETNSIYNSGHVGLYDYSVQTFDNFVLSIPPGYGPYRLQIALADATHAALSWTTNAYGWRLESIPSLTATNWDLVTNLPALNGTNFSLSVPTETSRFYRLHKP